MRFLALTILLLFQVGCATKYIVPGNRFMTPETQGGVLHSQFEFYQTKANQLTADVSNGSVKDGVNNQEVTRSGFVMATAFMDQLDLFWNHVGGGNSLFGGKFQFIGGSRTAKAADHKMAVSLAFGGNSHKAEGDDKVEFDLKGQEFQFLYGFRLSELFLLYSNLSYAKYQFSGEINSNDSSIDGLKPNYQTKIISLLGGLEVDVSNFFLKLECGYQRLQTSDTKDIANLTYGWSLGLTW